jgi:hypothetical protein
MYVPVLTGLLLSTCPVSKREAVPVEKGKKKGQSVRGMRGIIDERKR